MYKSFSFLSGSIRRVTATNLKNENSGLYDKTIGGHVEAGDSFHMTVIRECAEELGFPAAILSEHEFNRAIKVTDMNIVGIFKNGNGPTILYRTDMDALPMYEKTNLPYQSKLTTTYSGQEVGTMHSCGHDMHMTSWLGTS